MLGGAVVGLWIPPPRLLWPSSPFLRAEEVAGVDFARRGTATGFPSSKYLKKAFSDAARVAGFAG